MSPARIWLHQALIISALIMSSMPQTAEAQASAPYERTIIVSPVAGDSLASGAALRAAVASVNPTALSPWRIKLEPGIYHLGSQPLQLKLRMNLEGSGVDQTTILGNGQTVLDRFTGVLIGANKMELSNLHLECVSTAAAPWCIAMANVDTSPRITNVKFVAKGPHSSNWGIRNSGASPVIDRCQFTVTQAATNYGIVNTSGPTFFESHPTIRRSVILVKNGSTSNDGILNKSSSSPTLIEDTEITAFGGTISAAMRAFDDFLSGPVLLRRVTFLAHSATTTYGVGGGNYSTLTVEHSQIVALGPASHGILPDIFAKQQTDVFVSHSKVQGNATTVGGVEVDITFSELAGTGIVDAFIAKCAAVVDGTGSFHATTCP